MQNTNSSISPINHGLTRWGRYPQRSGRVVEGKIIKIRIKKGIFT